MLAFRYSLLIALLLAQTIVLLPATANNRQKHRGSTDITHSRPKKEELTEVHSHVPVFFVTDRRLLESSSAPLQFTFKEQVIDDLEYLSYGLVHEKVRLKHVPINKAHSIKAGSHSHTLFSADLPASENVAISHTLSHVTNSDSRSKNNLDYDPSSVPGSDSSATTDNSGTNHDSCTIQDSSASHDSSSNHYSSTSPDLSTKFTEPAIRAEPIIFPKVPDNQRFDYEQLVDALRKTNADRNGVIVHVHGCCMGFSYASREAAMTGAWLEKPVVLYDWGSPFGGYPGSLQACERSQARFNAFMNKLASEFPPEKITIVGFSLGNQLIVDFLLQNKDKRLYKDIILTRPDLDLVTFKSHLPELSAHSEQIHLYLAKNDIALHCSGSLRKLANPWAPAVRLGTAQTGFSDFKNVTVLDVAHVDALHSIPNSVMAELQEHNGSIPQHSKYFSFHKLENGIVEVSPN